MLKGTGLDSQQPVAALSGVLGKSLSVSSASGLQLSEDGNNGLGVGSKRQTGPQNDARFLV